MLVSVATVHVVQRWIFGKQTLFPQHTLHTPAALSPKRDARVTTAEAHIQKLGMPELAILTDAISTLTEWVILRSTARA